MGTRRTVLASRGEPPDVCVEFRRYFAMRMRYVTASTAAERVSTVGTATMSTKAKRTVVVAASSERLVPEEDGGGVAIGGGADPANAATTLIRRGSVLVVVSFALPSVIDAAPSFAEESPAVAFVGRGVVSGAAVVVFTVRAVVTSVALSNLQFPSSTFASSSKLLAVGFMHPRLTGAPGGGAGGLGGVGVAGGGEPNVQDPSSTFAAAL